MRQVRVRKIEIQKSISQIAKFAKQTLMIRDAPTGLDPLVPARLRSGLALSRGNPHA